VLLLLSNIVTSDDGAIVIIVTILVVCLQSFCEEVSVRDDEDGKWHGRSSDVVSWCGRNATFLSASHAVCYRKCQPCCPAYHTHFSALPAM